MELPQLGVTGLGGPAGGRDSNATTAGPLPKRGVCVGTNPCGPRLSSTGRRWWMHGKSRVRPTPRNAQRPVWFQRGDCRQGEPTRATFGDLPSSEAPFNRGTCRRWRKRSSSPCLPRARSRRQPEDAYPPSRRWLPWGGSPPYSGTGYGGSPRRRWIPRGNDSSGGPDLQLMAESCSRVGEWKIYAAAVLSFATLCRVGKISSLRRSNISKVGITYQGIKRDHRQIMWRPYAQAWASWLRRIAPGEAPALGRAANLETGMAKLLQGTDRGEARWHACRRAGATYLRWLGLPWRHLLWWGRWHSIKIAHLYASPPDEFECV